MSAQEYINQLEETKIKLKKLLFENNLPNTTKMVTPPQVGRFFEFYRPCPNFLKITAFPKHNIFLQDGKPDAKTEIVIEVFW